MYSLKDDVAHVDLSNNNLGDESCPILSEILKNTFNIVSLDLSFNNLSTHGVSQLFDALSKNQSLINLILGRK